MKVPNRAYFPIMRKMCYIFHSRCIAPEIMLRIRYNKPVKVPLTLIARGVVSRCISLSLTLVHYGKILHAGLIFFSYVGIAKDIQ